MNQEKVDKLARAMLYEGYVLYPYRPSVKNSQRWTFGGIYPKSWSEEQNETDACIMRTECLMKAAAGDIAKIHVTIRFLHLVDRTIGELIEPIGELPAVGLPPHRLVNFLGVGDEHFQAWQEAIEREIDLGKVDLDQLIQRPREKKVSFPSERKIEPLRPESGPIVGIIIRQQRAIEAMVQVSAVKVADDLYKISVAIENRTAFSDVSKRSRDEALVRSLISTHTILSASGADFISQTDPPEQFAAEAKRCKNVGTWPVLVGEGTEHDCVLSSPIILPDYPQLAPESPGDLFDGTEIDEILTLRIMTLTDAEKRAAAGVDERVRTLLNRTESLARDELASLHGTLRGLRPVEQEQSHG